MLRTIVVSLVSILVVSEVVFTQQMEDVVHLKNGRIIRGVIIEQIPDESVKIQLQDSSVSVFAMGEIAKIERGSATRFQQFVFQQYVGQRVRVTQDNVQIIGNVTRVFPGGFSLASEGGYIQSYNFNEGDRIEKSLGIKRNMTKGLLIGHAVGAVVASIIIENDESLKSSWESEGLESLEALFFAGGVLAWVVCQVPRWTTL